MGTQPQHRLARRLAGACRGLRETLERELGVAGSDGSALAAAWRGRVVPMPTADALAQALTFGAVAQACGLDVPWLAAAPPALLAPACAALGQAEAIDPDTLYEAFLGAYEPDARRRHGVFSTPPPLVRAQMRLVADVLQRGFGADFADRRVVLIDPAAGSGAYPLAALGEHAAHGAHFVLFEACVGAAVLARARLDAALGGQAGLACVRIEDALRATPAFEAPLPVCVGNPPYQRGRARRPTTLTDPQRQPAGVHAKNLHNDYVYFWRWALGQLFERRRGPGVVTFLTPASYLRGPAFEGLRQLVRRELDAFWIVDLEGDPLAARATDNVFAIRTPIAIGMGVRYGDAASHRSARVHYSRLDGSRADKLARLAAIRTLDDLDWQPVEDAPRATFVARATGHYYDWPLLTDLFPWSISGCQMKRTWPIAPSPELLRERWQALLALAPAERARAFGETRDRSVHATPSDLREHERRLPPLASLAPDTDCLEPVPYAYRSFDRQWVLPDARLGDFMRPVLWRSAGPRQRYLTSLLTNVLGSGPAAVATRLLPDLDHFRGSFGGRAVVPLWRDGDAVRPNIAAGVLDRLSARIGRAVCASDLFAYCYALLGGRGYVERFRHELFEPGPRIPLTADADQFWQAAALGQRLLDLHTFEAVGHGTARCSAPVDPVPLSVTYDPGRQCLRVGEGRFESVPPAVWDFSVSGLRVVASFLRHRTRTRTRSVLDRIRPTWSAATTRELLELLWTLEASLALEPSLDAALARISETAQPREALGLDG